MTTTVTIETADHPVEVITMDLAEDKRKVLSDSIQRIEPHSKVTIHVWQTRAIGVKEIE